MTHSTLGELVRHYMAHYPNGTGARSLSLQEASLKTGIPRSTLGKIVQDKVSWSGVMKKLLALEGGLGIPHEAIQGAVLGMTDTEEE